MLRSIFISIILYSFGAVPLIGQIDSSEVNQSPYSVVYNHLYHLQKENYDAEKSLLSFPKNPYRTIENSIKLKAILDGKGLYVDLASLPRNENYRDSSLNEHKFIPFEDVPDIAIVKYQKGWFYSKETLLAIESLYGETYQFGQWLPKIFPINPWHNVFLGLKIWQWLSLAILLALLFLLFLFFRLITKRILLKLIPQKFKLFKSFDSSLKKLVYALSLFLAFRLFKILLPQILLPPYLNSLLIKGIDIMLVVFVLLVGLRLIQFIFGYFETLSNRTENTLDDQLVPVLRKMAKLILVVIAILYILSILEVNITAILAGVSIGGLALALAAQDTVKNFLGSVMIFVDRPFQVGDWVEFDGVSGTIEEVSIRSTRIRTFENSLTYIPNGMLANKIIDNKGLRVYRRFATKIGIVYGTPPDKIELFVKGLRRIIEIHPTALNDRHEVHLNEFSSSSINIYFTVLFEVNTWSDELSSRHEILLDIMKLAKVLEVDFAFPTQTLYLHNHNEEEWDKSHVESSNKLELFLKQLQSGKISPQ